MTAGDPALDRVKVEVWGRAGRQWLSLPVLTASLRRSAADAELPPEVRRAAAAQLARLAAAGVQGADPRHWYAMTELTSPGVPIAGEVRLSPSRVETTPADNVWNRLNVTTRQVAGQEW